MSGKRVMREIEGQVWWQVAIRVDERTLYEVLSQVSQMGGLMWGKKVTDRLSNKLIESLKWK